MALLMQLIMSTLLIWKTQRNIDCNNQVFCFLINKLHRTLAESGGSVFVNLDEDSQSIFLKTAIVNLADKNEDREVSLGELREKSVEYLKEIFSLFDANNDKFLVGNESTLYNVSFRKVKAALILLFHTFDQNQDGHISTKDIPNEEDFDKNLDGEVSLVEIIQEVSGEHISNLIFLPRPFQTLIKKLDPSQDEQISVDEFELFTSQLFNVFDDDDDCHLSLDEVLEVVGGNKVSAKQLLKPYTKSMEQFIRSLIKRADVNEDDLLDLYEIIDFADFQFLSDSLKTFNQLGYPKFNRSSRSRWANILQIKDDVSVWLTLADKILQRKEFANESNCA